MDAFASEARQLIERLGHPPPLRVVDIGANPMKRQVPPYRAALDAGLIRLTGFEPQAEALARLRETAGPCETYRPEALGDGTGKTLNLYRGTGLASVLKIRQRTVAALGGLKRAARETGSAQIDTARLDDLGLRFDLLKIDIQGGELDVFRNARQSLAEAVAIWTEVAFLPLYEGQPLFADVDAELRAQGFVLHRFAHLVHKPVRHASGLGRSQLLDGDVIYVRDFTSDLDAETLTRLALASGLVLGSPDLTEHCLERLGAGCTRRPQT